VSNRRAKGRRRGGHPAKVAERRRPETSAGAKARAPQAVRSRAGAQLKPRRARPGRPSELGERLRRGWVSLVEQMLLGSRARRGAGAPSGARVGFAPVALTRADLLWALATAAVAAGLFAPLLTSFPWLGDGPETVTGVSTLGILHDPGYPSYVLIAHLFTLLIPFGSVALRVNLFSLVCAALNVAGVQLLARRLGAPRWACSAGALTLAASAGFWFYSGFAKHDMFSGLMFLLSLHMLVAWQARPATARLLALAVAVALGLGSSWPLEVLVLPAVAFVLLRFRRRLSIPSLASAMGVGLVLLAGIYGFVMIRAAQNPAIDWGAASTPSRLLALVRRSDFTAHGSTARGVAAAAGAHAHGASILANLGGDAAIFARELGILGLLLAIAGLAACLAWRRGAVLWALLIAFLANLIGASAVVDFGAGHGSLNGDLIDEGFVLGCYFVLAVLVAVGAGELVRLAAGYTSRLAAGFGSRGREEPLESAAADGHAPSAALASRAAPRRTGGGVLAAALAAALAAVLIVPLAVGNWSTVHRSDKPFATRYARAAFAELPAHAALFVMGAELTQPLIYRQVVFGQRRDVAVIAADGVEYGWYRQQLSRRLGVRLSSASGDFYEDDARLIRAVARVRPVYLDPQAAQTLSGVVGYRPVGLLEQLAPGRGAQAVASPAAVEARLVAAERLSLFPDRSWSLWPNDYVDQAEYATAALKAAQAFYQRRDFVGMRRALLNDLMVDPGNPTGERDLAALERSGLLRP
jgi:hypothetical protein